MSSCPQSLPLHLQRLPVLPRLWRRALATLRLWAARDFERRYLASLNDSQLRDMLLTRREVAEEAAKPVWRA